MATKEFDVLLQDDESPDDVVLLLQERFGVDADWELGGYNSAITMYITGTEDQLRRVTQWHNASHKPRPDLVGKPPVAKGEQRT